MGNYAVAADVEARFADETEGAYVTDNESAGTWDADVIDAAIELAEATINSKIGQRFATPVSAADLASSPETARLLKYWTVELADVHVLERAPAMSDDKRRQYDRTIAFLDAVRDGEQTLPGPITVAGTASRSPRAAWSDSTRTQPVGGGRLFTRDTTTRL